MVLLISHNIYTPLLAVALLIHSTQWELWMMMKMMMMMMMKMMMMMMTSGVEGGVVW